MQHSDHAHHHEHQHQHAPAKGSRADREVAEFEKQQAKTSARAALDALTGGTDAQ